MIKLLNRKMVKMLRMISSSVNCPQPKIKNEKGIRVVHIKI